MRNGSLRKEQSKMNEELNVNVGDEVLYRPSSYSRIEKISTVTKVTPTGRIRIDKSTNQFDKYGRQMGNVGWGGRDYVSFPIGSYGLSLSGVPLILSAMQLPADSVPAYFCNLQADVSMCRSYCCNYQPWTWNR